MGMYNLVIDPSPPRSYTTWLYNALQNDKRLNLPSTKELKFFSNYKKILGLGWYKELIIDGSPLVDISPSYASLNQDEIYEIFKEFKNSCAYIHLRHPIDRIISHFKHQLKLREGWALHHNIINNNYKKIVERYMDAYTTKIYTNYISLCRSWSNVYGEKCKIFKLKSSEDLLIEFYKHIGLDPILGIDYSKIYKNESKIALEKEVEEFIIKLMLDRHGEQIEFYENITSENLSGSPDAKQSYKPVDRTNFQEIENYYINNEESFGEIGSWKIKVFMNSIYALRGEALSLGLQNMSNDQIEHLEKRRDLVRACNLNECKKIIELIDLIDLKDACYSVLEEKYLNHIKVLQDEIQHQKSRLDIVAKSAEITSLNYRNELLKGEAIHGSSHGHQTT